MKPTPLATILRRIREPELGLKSLPRRLPTQEELKKMLHYDPDTGVFTRISSPSRAGCTRWSGTVAGTLKDGYVRIGIQNFQAAAHRIAWIYMTGEEPPSQIDHIDGDRSNNKWTNLRASNNTLNQYNIGLKKNNKSGFKGVSLESRRNKWRADIKVSGKQVCLGYFATPQEAAAAYEIAAKEVHQEFARLR